jgi:predicted nucleic acid-binding protein
VATRKAGASPIGQNGLGMTAKQSSQWMQFFRRRFTLLPDRDDLVTLWHELVYSLGILGVKSHDARLVAAMQSHGIKKLLTFNLNHFRAFPVTLLDPALLKTEN